MPVLQDTLHFSLFRRRDRSLAVAAAAFRSTETITAPQGKPEFSTATFFLSRQAAVSVPSCQAGMHTARGSSDIIPGVD